MDLINIAGDLIDMHYDLLHFKLFSIDNSLSEQTNGHTSSFWSLLPHHVIVTVFLELGARDLVQCSKVCQSWHQTLQGTNKQGIY